MIKRQLAVIKNEMWDNSVLKLRYLRCECVFSAFCQLCLCMCYYHSAGMNSFLMLLFLLTWEQCVLFLSQNCDYMNRLVFRNISTLCIPVFTFKGQLSTWCRCFTWSLYSPISDSWLPVSSLPSVFSSAFTTLKPSTCGNYWLKQVLNWIGSINLLQK